MFNFLLNGISDLQISMIITWIVILIVAVIFEIATSDLVSIWFAIGALGSLACAALNLEIYIQFVVFAVISSILILVTRPLVKKLTSNTEIPTNADRLIGKIAEVTVDVPGFGKGEVTVEFQRWGAISLNNQEFKTGSKVVIRKIEGNKLIVDAIQEIEIN